MLGNDDRGTALDRRPVVAEPCDERRELRQGLQLRLGPPGAVGQAEVHLEPVMTVRILGSQVVVVAVVPCDPAPCAGEQGRVQDLPVVVGRCVVGGEVGGDAELLEHDGLAEAARQLADERSGQGLPYLVVLHRIHVGPHEVDERRELAQRVAVVVPGHLDTPRPVSERDRLGGAGRADSLHDQPGPGGDLLARPGSTVERHLVRHEPPHDGRMLAEPPGDLRREPGLLGDEPNVTVEVAALPPRRVPVLAGHVADDEGRDRAEPDLHVGVEEVGEPLRHVGVEESGGRDEIRPEAERPGDVETVLGKHGELLADDARVVARPHARAAGYVTRSWRRSTASPAGRDRSASRAGPPGHVSTDGGCSEASHWGVSEPTSTLSRSHHRFWLLERRVPGDCGVFRKCTGNVYQVFGTRSTRVSCLDREKCRVCVELTYLSGNR